MAYIDATASAATRSRDIIIIMVTTSILMFGAFWNSRQSSWLNRRVQTTRDAVHVLHLQQELSRLPAVSPRRASIVRELAVPELNQAAKYLVVRRISDEGQLTNYLSALEQQQVNHIIALQIPFVGVVFDVNDLGLLGGITLVILVVWLRFALWRELINLSLTFQEAKFHHEPRLSYELLSMRQLLTVPPPLAHHVSVAPVLRPWNIFSKAIIAVPWFVHSLVILHDLDSQQWGTTVSPLATTICTMVGVALNILLGMLTILCYLLATKIEQRWASVAEDLASAPRD